MDNITRQSVLDLLNRDWAEYVARFQSLPPTAQSVFLEKQGYKRLTDLLAHVAAWWEVGLQNIHNYKNDPAARQPEINVDSFNARVVEKARALTEAEEIRIFEETRRKFIKLAQTLSEDDFRDERVLNQIKWELINHLEDHRIQWDNVMNPIEEIITDNASQNASLRELVKRISDDDLRLPLEAGWTVSAVLAHLAFWDQRAITLIRKWVKEGVGPSPIDTDVVNEATRSLCLAIPPRTAAELAVALATEVDKIITDLTPEMVEVIQTKGTTVKLRRAEHRRTHLGEIEKALEGRHK